MRFEALEPRVLLSADVNPAPAITGSIDVPGETDQYGFTLDQNTRVVFDSLTDNANINWSLTGPKGIEVSNKSFTTSDSADSVASPLLDLGTGDYTLTVDGISDTTGSYSFRLIDLLQTREITPGTAVSGVLDPARETDAYRFSATAGERFYFDAQGVSGGDVYWRLLDPHGRKVFGPTSMSSDVDVSTLAIDGSYTLLVEGRVYNSGTATYGFNVQKVADDPATALTIGTTVSGNIAHVGQRDFYAFSLADARQIYFDSFTNDGRFNWTLTGPRGTVVSARSFTASDSANLSGSAIYDLVAGDYSLTVDGALDTVGDYRFRLLDIGQAATLQPGTAVSGQLEPASETDLYRFSATAGERYFFDHQSLSADWVTTWRLLDPYGRLVFGSNWMSWGDVEPITLGYSGVYTLLVEGAVGAAGTSDYRFNVQKVTDEDVKALTVGATVSGNIAVTGRRDFYTFSLTEAKQLYFDSLTNYVYFNWTLIGPRGAVVNGRSFTASDSANLSGSAIYDLAAGNYTLAVDGVGDTVGDYSFRLLDLSQAAILEPGTAVSSQLNPASETDLYRFAANAGDQYYFDQQSLSGGQASWRLLDPWGRVVFGPSDLAGDIGPVTLGYTGTYTLLVEGNVAATGTTDYAFNVDFRGNVPVTPLPTGTPMALGNTVAGVLNTSGQQDHYSLSLAGDTRIYFDSFTNNYNISWSLVGPRGTVASNRSFNQSDSWDFGSGAPVYDLGAGDYVFAVTGSTTGGYSFRVMDVSQALQITSGTAVNGQLSPANETDLYQFNATAGERYYFDNLSYSGGDVYWRLLDPYGRVVFDRTYFGYDVDPITLSYGGTYTLLIEGRYYTTGTVNYGFSVQKVTDDTASLTVGTTVSGNIAHVGQRDFYTFSLTEAKQLYFDSLTNYGGFTWSLSGPRGTEVSGRNFTSSDSRGGAPLYDLGAGDYTLVVDGAGDAVGNYSFRLLDVGLATSMTPGTAVSGQLSPANGTDMYRFGATAGEQYYFDKLSLLGTGFNVDWRLLDPYGRLVFDSIYVGNDVGPIALEYTGTYTLLIEGRYNNTGWLNYNFIVRKITDDTAAMTVDTTVSGTIGLAGQRDFYTFSLAEAKQIYFDSFTNSGNFNWTLTGPLGTVVNARSFTASDSVNLGGSAIYDLVAGNYTLLVDGVSDTVGNYSFRLLDLNQTVALEPGTAVSGQLNPANETDLYRLAATAGERYFFDIQSLGNYGSTATWRLLDPYGRVVFGPTYLSSGDVDVVTLGFSGTYTLMIEGRVSAGGTNNYNFNVQKVADDPASTLTIGTTVSGNIAHAGQRDFHTFSLGEAKRLYFDSFTNNSGFNWTLAGPLGTVVNARSFTVSDSVNLSGSAIYDLVAGDYTLTVDGALDRVGDYGFRLLGLGQAATLEPGTAVSGQLDPANETDLYQFTAMAGERYFFGVQSVSGSQPYWRLLDPHGRVVFGPTYLSSGDVDVVTLGFSGTYTLMIEGTVNAGGTNDYSFNVQKVSDETAVLTVGDIIAGSIAHAGQRDFYAFSLAEARRLYFDSFTDNGNFKWTLTGPRGTVVTARSFAGSDSANLSASAIYDLVAGDYTLVIDGAGDTVGNYSFRLLDVGQATTLESGTAVSSQLNPANETDLYRFSANAGERYYFDYQNFSGSQPYWRLLDPWGRVVFGPNVLGNDIGPSTLGYSGVYTLLIEGTAGATGTSDYRFNVQKVTDEDVKPLTVGTTVSGNIPQAGQRDFYTFNLAETKQLYFDSFTNNSNFNWTLTGSRGAVVSGQSFTGSDSVNLSGSAIYDLVAGDYSLMVDGVGDTVGDYGFRWLDLSQAATLEPGTAVSGQLSPANETDLYRFSANAGDQYYFDYQSLSNAWATGWRLLDPYGRVVFGPGWMSNGDVGPLTLSHSGVYTLLIEGAASSIGTTDYVFNVDPRGNVPVAPLPAGTPLAMGSTVAGVLSTGGQQDYYSLTLASDTRIYFDSFTNNYSINWSLTGPRGTVVSNRSFNQSDSLDFGNGAPVYDLVAGDYVFTVRGGTTGGYSFRVMDVAQASVLTPGTAVSGQLSPANETDLYRFSATAGEQYYFDKLSLSGSDVYWRLLDSYGGVVFGPNQAGNGDIGPLTLEYTGTYTLLIEGRYYTAGTANYGFNVQKVADDTAVLTVGSTVTAAIAHSGQRDFYTFSLAEASQLYFDSLTNNSNLTWSLSGPRGMAVSGRNFTSSDSWDFGTGAPVYDLVAGDYTLIVDGAWDIVGNYSFRLLDVGQATVLMPGTVVTGQLSPANETDLYRFSAIAGEQYYFDRQGLSGADVYWRLLDPYGRVAFDRTYMNSSDVGPLALDYTGSYTLLIEGRYNYTIGTANYSFNVQRITDDAVVALTVGSTVTGAIAHTGQRDFYTFGLAEATRFYLDSFTNNNNFNWTLTGPRGMVVSQTSLSGDTGNIPFYDLVAGDYTLIIGGWNDAVGEYTFRALDLGQATVYVPGTLVSGQLNPANETDLYRFSATAGDQYYFDRISVSSNSVYWRLLDPYGRLAFSTTSSDVGPLTLAYTGTYTLLIEGYYSNTGTRDYSFSALPVPKSAKIILSNLSAEPGPDLVVQNLAITPVGEGAVSGGQVVVSWDAFNAGNLPTSGTWTDRVLVRNTARNEIVGNFLVSYDDVGAEPLQPGTGRSRQITVPLPDGNRGAGTLSFQVMLDVANSVTEPGAGGSAEMNNSATASIESQLVPYADLQVGQLSVEPAGAWATAAPVTIRWRVSNGGDAEISRAWNDRVLVRNLTNSLILASADLRYDPSLSGNFAVGAFLDRAYSFTWPGGTAATGQFEFVVTTDFASEIVENNLADSGETNNTLRITGVAGPDLSVANLRVASDPVQAGALVTVEWEDWNSGAVAVPTGFSDRITVINRTRGETLLNTSLAYNPADPGAGLIGPGEYRSRIFTFRLPDGIRGAGDIEIRVVADQNASGYGSLFENNAGNTAESNNAATVQTLSTAVPYADLRVDMFSAPATGVGGEPIAVAWTVANRGQAGIAVDWNDQVIFSNDAVIGDGDDVVIGTIRHTGGLGVGESYTVAATVKLPYRTEGRYYLALRSDAGAEVLEPDTRADNVSGAQAIDLATPYTDLAVSAVSAPAEALSGENVLVTWEVRNDGNATTDLAFWNDRVVLSRDTRLSADDLVLSGSVTHAGPLAPGQSYAGRATLSLPRDLNGDFYVIADTNTNRTVTETGRTGNNAAASVATLHVGLAPVPDLTVADVAGPTALRPGDAATVTYTVSSQGMAAATGSWRDRIYLDRGAAGLYQVASAFHSSSLEAGANTSRNVGFTLPSSSLEGEFRWLVKTDSDDTVYEREGEDNNQASSADTVRVARVDLAVAQMSGPSLVQSGAAIHVEWTVANSGGEARGNWVDRVFLSKDGVSRQVAEVAQAGPLVTGGSYTAAADFEVPLEFSGEYELVVIADAGSALDEHARSDNRYAQALSVELAPYADLAVTALAAPEVVIDDPAPLDVAWTVANQGSGAGRSNAWTDRIVLSRDDALGNSDDWVVGEYRHDGLLAAGESYSRAVQVLLPAATTGRYKLFVVSDAKSEVFENGTEANNIGRPEHDVDVMPTAYADLQVESVVATGTAASGRPLHLEWSVANNGIGITSTAQWSDSVWLSRNPDGSGAVAQFGSFGHIGQLAVGDRYSRSIDVTLPEGIEGDFYLNVRTGGPFEFVFTDNNTGSTAAIPVQLSPSPDLKVETVSLPTVAQEGTLIDVSWSVVNQGEAAAVGVWVDSLVLVPVDGGNAVTLGSFTYDRGLESGIRYTRTEQVRLPSRIEGLYRVKVVTNANLGGTGSQVYEHGTARDNNVLLSGDRLQVNLDDRPDLRVGTLTVPEHVTAGTAAAIRYTIANQGPAAAGGHWKDKVYLSLDGNLSGDDLLVGQFDNGAALAPTESYAMESAAVDIPIRYRGDAYLLVVADGNYNVDEYPNESNNVKAALFYVDPVPFADLVTGDVVAPDQAVHGSSIEVRYKVSNLGSAATRGESATLSSWTDSVWLARDKRRPGAYKGDVLLGSVTHSGHLAVGEDYLGTVQVAIPDNTLSGSYYITVWSDTYDAILEDTLAINLNPDDLNQADNNNYKARPIAVLGITPPDLAVTEASGLAQADAGGSYSFSYTVQNRGDLFSGRWSDSVFITDNPNLDLATEVWAIGSYSQERSLGSGERYSVTQTLQLDPAVKGRYVVVKTDARPWSYRSGDRGEIGELDEGNNARAADSVVTVHPADLRVTSVETLPENFSGEETTITWTVANQGEAVWAGTLGWVDSVYFSADPTFIPGRAIALGAVVHSSVAGLAAGASYTASAKFKLPPGTDGPYYIYVITDSEHRPENLADVPDYRPHAELLHGGNDVNERSLYYATSAYEGARFDNNLGQGTLHVTYREPDLQIDTIAVSDPNPASGQQITVTWTASNRGTRATRTNSWYDGIYLSRDASLDGSDYPLVDRGSPSEVGMRVRLTSLTENGQPKFLQPGESYTNSATFNLPESIGGDFHIIVKADTVVTKDPYRSEPSTIRDGLDTVAIALYANPAGAVLEFKDEGNNIAFLALPITLVAPPDLQVAQVTAPDSVLAGQGFTVSYRVVNAGGDTPGDQSAWNDLVYLSKDRFLDVNQDRYVGYLAHNGGLAAGGSYDASLQVTAPRDLEGAWYVFVVADPARAWGTGETGRVREFGKEQNNATAAAQPIRVETPPPADLKVAGVALPASAGIGDEIQVDFSVLNDSINTAYGRWTDALYLSSDNAWDLGDVLLGKVEHVGDLGANGSYTGTLRTKLPPLRDGNWRVIVRPDLYNEVFEGKITYTAAGLSLPPGEADNRQASGATLAVHVPVLEVASPLETTLSAGQAKLYKVSVAGGETLRVTLDSSAGQGANEVYVRYGDIPTGYLFDAAYSDPLAPDQQALVPSTRAGDYYVLVKSRQGGVNVPVTLRADLLPLSITRITPDQGGTGDADHRWVTLDIYGSRFKAGALVKLARPGVYEVEPQRWQVLDATHIRAVFDLRSAPHGLYDVSVMNPDGQTVTEAYRYLVERGIEADVTIGIGGPRSLNPGERGIYSVALQSLTNVDTPYVRFDFGATDMGDSAYVLEGLSLPYVVFGSNVGGRPDGATADAAGNTQGYGPTPTAGLSRADIPWASLDGAQNTQGFNLAPGYAVDVAAGGFVGMTFNLATYPGLQEWLNYDFAGLRDKLYALRPEWKEQGLLDNGVSDLDKIQPGLTAKFLSHEPKVHITPLEALAMPFRFNLAGAATPLTRDEFVAEQSEHAQKLRSAILADSEAPSGLAVLAADEAQWTAGWLGALESAGLLRPAGEAPPIRDNPKVISLNATLASGILLAKGGEDYRTQGDVLGFFAKVQQWYGDTAKYAGDPGAAKTAVDYTEVRIDDEGNEAHIPVPVMADPADFTPDAAHATHFLNFNVYAGGRAELEYLRHVGVLDEEFRPVAAQSLNLSQYLQQAAEQNAEADALVAVRGPQAALAGDGNSYVPAGTPLPYSVAFQNPADRAVGQLRIVSELDAGLDPRSLRLGDLKIGDINVHLPGDKAHFQGDFDFSASRGFILRVSAGVDAETRIATWLLQAIDPDTGEVLRDPARGLLAPSNDPTQAGTAALRLGFAAYTVKALDTAQTGAVLATSARIFLDDAPPADSAANRVTLDAQAPATTVAVTSLGSDAQGAPSFDVRWNTEDDASGVKSVTVYVAEDGGDFKIWQRQVAPEQAQALFSGVAGKRYEFLAVAVDNAGNREAASVANAVLPDDGSRQAVLDALGVNETLTQTAELPLATESRRYAVNALFEAAMQQLPGSVAPAQPGDLSAVLDPFTLRGFAEGFAAGPADIGALALVELPDGSVLASAGEARNRVFRFPKEGGRSVTPLFSLDEPVLDMALDGVGQLWAMTGSALLQVDAGSGEILRRLQGPGEEPLTHALAIQPETGDIYVSSGNGIEIFRPGETDPAHAWTHFSKQRVGDLAFGPDGRLWAVAWSGSDIAAAQPDGSTDLVSFPLSGRTAGRAELEYRLRGTIDSIAFGATGTELAGLLIASSNLKQRPVVAGVGDTPHQSSVWMVELQSRRLLQLATGGTRGESIIATRDGRILIAETGHIDEIAPRRPPHVTALSVADGALVPLPLGRIGIQFDQAMWLGDSNDEGSVLNPDNYTFTALGSDAGRVIAPQSVVWDAISRTVWLDVNGLLPAGQYQIDIGAHLQSSTQVRLDQGYASTFTALLDMSHRVQLDFANTRADRATGEVSYDVSLTNIGTDDLNGPLMLLLDPGRYFDDGILDAAGGGGDQSDLWLLDLSAGLQSLGGKLPVGATLADQTVTLVPASRFATLAGMADLVKANLGHGVYALPQPNLPPRLGVAGSDFLDADALAPAAVGQAWSGQIEAVDPDGTQFFFELLQAPEGVTLTREPDYTTDADGYHHAVANLNWTPSARDLAATEIVVRVTDSRGGIATRRFQVPVLGGNHAPSLFAPQDLSLQEGEVLSLPLQGSDADGDPLTLTVRNLPAGAVFDAATGLLSWLPGYDQAGHYADITVIASDGKATVAERFNLTVEQGYARPKLGAVAPQTLREGDPYALQLAGFMPGGLEQADGTTITLEYAAPWLPGGATLNPETGWLQWTPGYAQHGDYRVPVTLTATYTQPDGEVAKTSVSRDLLFSVLNANGAPVFAASTSLSTGAAETWHLLEGQPLRLSVFAYDPDNPDFEPRIRLNPLAPATGPEGSAASVAYRVDGLPEGAAFDAETLEILWTPGYAQAGTYTVTVTATDDGDPSTSSGQAPGTPAVSQIVLPLVVSNANRAPDIGDISNAFVDKGAVLEIPVQAVDADGNPLQLTLSGLPRFASYVQGDASAGQASGTIRFAPGEGDRGDYVLTVVAQDDGGGDATQVLTQAKSFVLTVRSSSEAPVITAPRQVVAVAGQPLSVPILVQDLDQDALSYSAEGLPIGAELIPQSQYGHALLIWTPSLDDLGSRDITLAVTDSGLPPQDAGYANPDNPIPNTTHHTLRLIVRAANALPELLGVMVDGVEVADTGDAVQPIRLHATEGVPLAVDLFGRDTDADLIDWKSLDLPRGMRLEVPAAGNGNHALLRWTPDTFAAQDGNTGTPGLWRFSVQAGDGAGEFTRTFEIAVANVNQTPRLLPLPLPLQLVKEGETLSFTLKSADADRDPIITSLVYDENTPEGVYFDPKSGTFEWTPDQTAVDNALGESQPFRFTFRASDGTATTTQTVQVRVFDVNRIPRLEVSNHAVVVGDTLSLPVQLGGSATGEGIHAADADGDAQTQALAIRFTHLPEGALFDPQSRRLTWTPGPGQIGDFTITAQAFDGQNTATQTFTVRVVADASANAPHILISTTPSTPALPGQTVVATVRSDAYSAIAHLAVQVRGEALGTQDWQTMALDGAGRLRLTPTQPGLIEIQVTATDRDGFSATETHTVRVKDPGDTQAPELAWGGNLAGADAWTQPLDIARVTSLQAALQERQLMGYKLELAPALAEAPSGLPLSQRGIEGDLPTGAWRTLAEENTAAAAIDGLFALGNLDPAQFANGVYHLRLTAWDIAGRTTEIAARVVIDTADKQWASPSATDAVYTLAGHDFALTRMLGQGAGEESHGDFGNWRLPLLDTALTTDQPATTASGMTAPWMEGARVWLQIPASLGTPDAAPRTLRFTLSTARETLGTEPGAPAVWHPAFSDSQGWQLQAHGDPGRHDKRETLDRQGQHLYDHATGLPWRPAGYTLTGSDGTRYQLDAQGKINAVTFSDGAAWLVSDAGIAAVAASVGWASATGTAETERVDFLRDSQGRIVRATGPDAAGEAQSIAYRYDAQGRLSLARNLRADLPLSQRGTEGDLTQSAGNAQDLGTPYGYDAAGQPYADRLTANLGAAVNWLGNSTANTWSGPLTAGETISLAFSIRQSELDATVKIPGARGAVILALETDLADPQASLEVVGGTVIGRVVSPLPNLESPSPSGRGLGEGSGEGQGVRATTLIRVTEAGLKLIRL
ncbi:MAG TPA: CARDB domain-containing protein, partial [Methylococcaceae bacterium]|nr:CARDB domain-containing protein [Methylococcaceae bacterium]